MTSGAIEIRAGRHVGQIASKTIAKLTTGTLPRGTGYVYRLVNEYEQALRRAVSDAGLPADIARDHAINECMRAERHALYCQWLLREPDRAAKRAARAVREAAAELPEDERPSDDEIEQRAAQAAHAAAQQHALSLDHRIALSREIVRATRDRNRAFDSLGLDQRDLPASGLTIGADFLPTDPDDDDLADDDPPDDPPPGEPDQPTADQPTGGREQHD